MSETRSSFHGSRRGPAFICVGPEKTGTSWLYANLAPHPDVFLLPVKEIRYFYEVVTYPHEKWWSRLSSRGDWHAQDCRAYLRERLEYYLKRPRSIKGEWPRFAWDWRYLFGHRSDEWYFSLFAEAGQRLSGDISPQYLSLPDDQLRRICDLLPDVKVIILLRDPIDWSWSFARMSLIGKRKAEDIPDEEFRAFFDTYMNYYPTLAAIERWHQYFPPKRVHVGFYDMICEDPRRFYGQVCDFLEIDERRAPDQVQSKLSSRVNEGRNIPMPHRLELYLARNWSGEVERLCKAFTPYPQRWSQHCSRILGDR